MKNLIQTGKYLFRYRAAIAAVFFAILVFCAKPVSSTIAHILIVIGIVLRLWAAGYIGPEARKTEFSAGHIIKNGPYRFLKHPLYVGNFFLVLGVVMLYNPPRWTGLLYMIVFVLMYAIIATSERQFLKEKSTKDVSFRFNSLTGEISTMIVVGIIYVVYFLLLARS